MTKFNTSSTTSKLKPKSTRKIVNVAGGEAFEADDKFKFVSILLTSFVNDQYYRSANETLKELKELMPKVGDWKFVAKAAIYARIEFGMRSITHAAAGEIVKAVKGETWTKAFYSKVVYRTDDITEILSYYLARYKRPIPNSLKKGLGHALGKFDEYSLSKYRGDGKAISLVDAVNLLHPKPTDKNREALKKLVAGTLKSTETWEAKLTTAGQKAKNEDEKKVLKKEAWQDLIQNKKIKYFALLRNLRNIAEQAPDQLPAALEMLVDPRLIKHSLVLPFRFSTAIEQITETQTIRALNKALDIAVDNVPKFDGKMLVAIDHSGSMHSMGAGKSPIKIASLFGAIMAKSNNADVMIFGDTAAYLPGINPDDSTLTIAKHIEQQNDSSYGWNVEKYGMQKNGKVYVGHGTNFQKIFESASLKGEKYDRVIIFSDMQAWKGYYTPAKQLQEYQEKTGAVPYIYSFDLAGHGSIQFPRNRCFQLAGFSEKIFDVMKVVEEDRNELYKVIDKIEL